jgi:hypothetical protein
MSCWNCSLLQNGGKETIALLTRLHVLFLFYASKHLLILAHIWLYLCFDNPKIWGLFRSCRQQEQQRSICSEILGLAMDLN